MSDYQALLVETLSTSNLVKLLVSIVLFLLNEGGRIDLLNTSSSRTRWRLIQSWFAFHILFPNLDNGRWAYASSILLGFNGL
jgi:hypothetical protein